MSELRSVVARNITELRQKNEMTQLTLANRLSYSDKAISKWERGESFPDIFMLKKIADLFGVTVDYLLTEDHSETEKKEKQVAKYVKRNRIIISILANMLIWLIATVAFVTLGLVHPDSSFAEWLVFFYAFPLSCVTTIVFNSIWGRRKLNYLVIAVMSWSILIAFYMTYLTLFDLNIWLIFIIGIPVQIIISLWSGINYPRIKRKEKRRKRRRDTAHDATAPSDGE